MSLSARAGYGDDNSARMRSSAGSIASFLGGAAVALVGLAGGWTAYTHFMMAEQPVAASVSERFDAISADLAAAEEAAFNEASFAERFDIKPSVASAADLLAKPKKNVYVALLDPTYSLGNPPSTFSIRQAPAAAPAPQVAEARKTETQRSEDALLSRTPAQLALNVPLPASRPSEPRVPQSRSANAFGHDALVQRARQVLATAKPQNASIFEKLFGGGQPAPTVLAYAGPDGGVMADGRDSTQATGGPTDRATAVYDISAKKVYMPDGSRLEAHSGLGNRLDDPRYASERMRGVTPPHIYDLTAREALFHGVAAIRLTPVGGEGAIFGRSGLLAHTYMLGPNGDSNGCISFKDYNAFLRAFRNGDVKRLIVVSKLD